MQRPRQLQHALACATPQIYWSITIRGGKRGIQRAFNSRAPLQLTADGLQPVRHGDSETALALEQLDFVSIGVVECQCYLLQTNIHTHTQALQFSLCQSARQTVHTVKPTSTLHIVRSIRAVHTTFSTVKVNIARLLHWRRCRRWRRSRRRHRRRRASINLRSQKICALLIFFGRKIYCEHTHTHIVCEQWIAGDLRRMQIDFEWIDNGGRVTAHTPPVDRPMCIAHDCNGIGWTRWHRMSASQSLINN